VHKLRDQLNFYLGNSNLLKDETLRSRLEKSTLIEIDYFLACNNIKTILDSTDREASLALLKQAIKKS
jgi:hypothetical protein